VLCGGAICNFPGAIVWICALNGNGKINAVVLINIHFDQHRVIFHYNIIELMETLNFNSRNLVLHDITSRFLVHLFLIKGKYQASRMLVHDIIKIDIFVR